MINKKILVIGDIMLDINHFCNTTRNAPEALELPVYNIYKSESIFGGAANVANNLKRLDNDVILLSVIGGDFAGKSISDLLFSTGITSKLFVDQERLTTQKIRLFCNDLIVNRHDIESTFDVSDSIRNVILDYIASISDIDAIIISDYAKGIITKSLCQKIIQYANQNDIPTFVDPKVIQFEKYKGCFCFKPNLLEGSTISRTNDTNKMFDFIRNNICCNNIVLTCGKDGIYCNSIDNHIQHFDKINVVDVTGCGDTVISVLVHMWLQNNNLVEACQIANYVAGKAVGVIGNYSVSLCDISSNLQAYPVTKLPSAPLSFSSATEGCNVENPTGSPTESAKLILGKGSRKSSEPLHSLCGSTLFTSNATENRICNKIIYDYEFDKISDLANIENLVFTNGCFDIIHSAHIRLLKYAKSLGKVLVVGLNSNVSVKNLKGENRPINDETERSTLLTSLDWVDYVIIFNESTPYNILKLLKPSIIVKGGDYSADQIIGREFCDRVVLFNYLENCSTTNIINKVCGQRSEASQEKNVYLLSHNGLGDNVAMNGAVHFLTKYYDKVYFLCKDIYIEQIEYLYKDYAGVVPIAFNSNNEYESCIMLLQDKYTNSDVIICGCHKNYLETKITHPLLLEQPSCSYHKLFPTFYWFIEMFYLDIGIPLSTYYDYYKLPEDISIIDLYNDLSKYKIVFFHTSMSNGSNVIDTSLLTNKYLDNEEYIFICANENLYPHNHHKFDIAQRYIYLPTIFHYVEIIKNSTIIRITDSSISCMILPLIKSGEIKTRDIHIYNRLTGEILDISILC